jgi:chorismate dehydratase
MRTIRLGAVGYLNARPLVHGLDRQTDLFDVRFDVPSKCATLLHENAIDLGLIPSIENAGRDYQIVPGIGVVSRGPVASVALFSSRPLTRVRSIALDSTSRTSAGLLRVLCAHVFGIAPEFRTLPPNLPSMLQTADAALLIGDSALFIDPDEAGVEKIDLGDEWTKMTGLPFVWAFWAGRPGMVSPTAVQALTRARDAGTAAIDAIAAACLADHPERVEAGKRYLRENIKFIMGSKETAGLRRYYELAGGMGLVPADSPIRFYEG